MNKAMAMIRVLLVGIGFIVLVAMWIQTQEPPQIIYIQDPNYVQPPIEAQRRLKEQGFYDGPLDNKWGVKSDTGYCNWCAAQTFKPEYYVSP